MNFSNFTKEQLCELGANCVGKAIGVPISKSNVKLRAIGERSFWFEIGEMYFFITAGCYLVSLAVCDCDDKMVYTLHHTFLKVLIFK